MRLVIRKRGFFFPIRVGLHGVLRTNQCKELIRALKVELLRDAVLRPTAGHNALCRVERASVGAFHDWNFEVKSIVFLADLDGGESAHALVGTVEGRYELLLIIVRDVQLEAEAHAVSFECALPNAFCARDGIRRLSRAGPGCLAMENEPQADAALGPATVDAAVIR